jgi:hypothetical protein
MYMKSSSSEAGTERSRGAQFGSPTVIATRLGSVMLVVLVGNVIDHDRGIPTCVCLTADAADGRCCLSNRWLSTFEDYLKIAGPILVQILDIVSLAEGVPVNQALVGSATNTETTANKTLTGVAPPLQTVHR